MNGKLIFEGHLSEIVCKNSLTVKEREAKEFIMKDLYAI